MDVAAAAWRASGSPASNPDGPAGLCARCGWGRGPRVRVADVVSRSFAAFDTWRLPGEYGLCAGCSWAYRTPALRQSCYLVTATPTIRPLSTSDLLHTLEEPLSAASTVLVPVRPGRKHVLPTARWGRISADDVTISWTAADVSRLQTMRLLRSWGFGAHQLVAAAPPWHVVRTLAPADRMRALAHWPELDPWRSRPPWLEVATRATNEPQRPQ